jgi:hypothetical protein
MARCSTGAALYPFDVKAARIRRALPIGSTDNGITILRGVPTFFRSFMASVAADRTFPAVRIVSLGGEPMLGQDLTYLQSALRAALRAHARVRSDRVPHRLLGARSPRHRARRRKIADRPQPAGKDVLLWDERGRKSLPERSARSP